MKISTELISQLRKMSDAGILDCKKALQETNGDLEKAMELLREKGLSSASKKADRIAAEGSINVCVNSDYTRATMLEINTETDFVAKGDIFKDLSAKTLNLIAQNAISSTEELNRLQIDGNSFEEFVKTQIAKIGENIVVRRFVSLDAKDTIVNGYLHHNAKIGAILALSFKNAANKPKLIELSKNLSIHAATMKPQMVSFAEIDDDFIQKEKIAIIAELEKENVELKRLGKPLKHIPEFVSQKELSAGVLQKQEEKFKEKLKAENKPEKIWDKILPGMLDRFIFDNTLLDQRLTMLGQLFVFDEKKTIAQVLKEKSAELNDEISIVEFVRFELGEGIEKKIEDFASEVAKQM